MNGCLITKLNPHPNALTLPLPDIQYGYSIETYVPRRKRKKKLAIMKPAVLRKHRSDKMFIIGGSLYQNQ